MHIDHGVSRNLWRTIAIFAAALSLAACQSSPSKSGGTTLIIAGAGGTGGAGGAMMNGAGGAGATLGEGGAGGEAMNGAGGAGGEMMGGTGGAGGEMMGGAGGHGGAMTPPGAGGAGGGQDGACDRSEYTAERESFQEDDEGVLRYVAYSSNPSRQNPITDILLIELHPSRGFPMETGTYDLAQIGSDLSTCQICILSFRQINVTNGQRQMNLMARSGQIEITALGDVLEPFAATVSGMNLEQVNVSRDNLNRLVTDFPAGGATLCLDGFEFDVIRKPRPAMIGQPVLDFTLQNCLTEELVSVAEIARSTQAIWFLGTAGWCPACRTLMLNGDPNNRQVDSPFRMAEELGPERLRIMIVLGEDGNRQQADARYCRQYARAYADNAADFYVDHDGTRSFAQLFTFLNTYASGEGMFGLPWNAVVSGGEEHIYRYADRSGQAERLGQIISELTTDPEGPMMEEPGMEEPGMDDDGME